VDTRRREVKITLFLAAHFLNLRVLDTIAHWQVGAEAARKEALRC
jgi:hypothetical protein